MSNNGRQQVSTYDLHVHVCTHIQISTCIPKEHCDYPLTGISLWKRRNPAEKSQHSVYMCLEIRSLIIQNFSNFISPSLISFKVVWFRVMEHTCCKPLTWEGKSKEIFSDLRELLKGLLLPQFIQIIEGREYEESLHQVTLKQWSRVLLSVL